MRYRRTTSPNWHDPNLPPESTPPPILRWMHPATHPHPQTTAQITNLTCSDGT